MELTQFLKSDGIFDRERKAQERPPKADHGSLINIPFDTFDTVDDLLRQSILLLPAFQGDRAAEVLFLWPLLFLESVLYFLTPTVLPIADVRVDRIAHHNKVYGTTESKEICLVVHIEFIISGAVEPSRFATPAIKMDVAKLR